MSDAFAKRIWFWATMGASVAGLGFGSAQYLGRAASAADVQAIDRRLTTVEERSRALEDDIHWLRDQVAKIAESVGAERVPLRNP